MALTSGPCLIQVQRWVGDRTTHIGFVTSLENFLGSMTFSYEDMRGKHYYFDATKINLTRDTTKALQVEAQYEDDGTYYYVIYDNANLARILGLGEGIQAEYSYRDSVNGAVNSLYIFPILREYTLESIQDRLDRYDPLPRKTISKAMRQQVYNKCQGHCAYCGKEIDIEDMQVDHIVSHMGNKGKDDIDNYLPACKLCNHAKCTYTIENFRSYIEKDAPRIHFKKGRKIRGEGAIADRIVTAYGLKQGDNKVIFYFERSK